MRMLEGHVAGEPVSCIPTTNSGNQLIVLDELGVVYDAGDTLYVARASEPKKLRWTDRAEFIRASGRKLCVSDEIWTIDRRSGFPTGAVVHLEDFVPYTKPS